MAHDFENYPELTNNQMQYYYFNSPHKQIGEDFSATVVKVHDGDTVTLSWVERDFDFPLRFENIAAPELDESGGKDSQQWMENRILGKEVDIKINKKNRVGKFGRILGKVFQGGVDVGLESVFQGHSLRYGDKGGAIL